MKKKIIKGIAIVIGIILFIWGYDFFGKAIYIEIVQPNEKSDLTQVVIEDDTEYVFYKGTPLIKNQLADEYDVVYQLKSNGKMTEEYVLDGEFYDKALSQHFFGEKEIISDAYSSVFTYNPKTEILKRKEYFKFDMDAKEGTIQDGGADTICNSCEKIITTSTKTINETEKELNICKMESDECKKRIIDNGRKYREIFEVDKYFVIRYDREVQNEYFSVFELYDDDLNYISELELEETKRGLFVDGRLLLMPGYREDSIYIEELTIEDGKLAVTQFSSTNGNKYMQTLPFRDNQPLAFSYGQDEKYYGVLSIENEELVFENLQPEEYTYGFEVSHQLPDGTFLCTMSMWKGEDDRYKQLEKIIEYDFEKQEVIKVTGVEKYNLRDISIIDKVEKSSNDQQ